MFELYGRFNPRAREGRDQRRRRVGWLFLVSIHAPARGATTTAAFAAESINVSIHAPARGATYIKIERLYRIYVSIHAPARGATGDDVAGAAQHGVSIHAPARGATPLLLASRVSMWSFNPRAREGRDMRRRHLGYAENVSIHAPARGATLASVGNSPVFGEFQSTRPRGARPVCCAARRTRPEFQSTRPRGARRRANEMTADELRFNPRAREGRDIICGYQLLFF